MEQKEPVEKKICKVCEKEKKITSFTKLLTGNRGSVCNLCKSLGHTIKKKNPTQRKVIKNNPLSLGNVSIKDYVLMYQFLERAGYTLGNNDIHEQFCKKYNLKPKKKKAVFNNHYSEKDCGLI
jgi:hypothetical protein